MNSLFSSLDEGLFFNKYWGKYHYKFKTQISTPDATELLAEVLASNIQYPDFRIVQRGGSITPYLYTNSDNKSLSNQLNTDKFKKLDLSGKTIKVSGLDRHAKEVGILASTTAKYFQGTDISINGYFSGERAQGGSAHYDFYHIFALQISGEKKWQIGHIVENNPHKDFGHQLIENVDFIETVITQPGDVLYLPPGIWHDVSTETGSVHFAIGIQTPRVFNLLQNAILTLSKKSDFLRSDLPIKYQGRVEINGLSENDIEQALSILRKYLQENDGAEFL